LPAALRSSGDSSVARQSAQLPEALRGSGDVGAARQSTEGLLGRQDSTKTRPRAKPKGRSSAGSSVL
jgi:hypothetical protein